MFLLRWILIIFSFIIGIILELIAFSALTEIIGVSWLEWLNVFNITGVRDVSLLFLFGIGNLLVSAVLLRKR